VAVNRVRGVAFENVSKAGTCDTRLVDIHRFKQFSSESVTVFLDGDGSDILAKGSNERTFDSHLVSFELVVYHCPGNNVN
jgi:hypothetical protein